MLGSVSENLNEIETPLFSRFYMVWIWTKASSNRTTNYQDVSS